MERPPYPITSVDNALCLVQIISRDGVVRVKDAAAELGVSKSTAHRLLAMLCFRGFAAKDGEHQYRAGPALPARAGCASPHDELCLLAGPYMHRLAREVGETVHLMVLRRDTVQFVASVEGSQSLRVGSRLGTVLGAHQTSGGQVLLAELPDDELASRFPGGPPDTFEDWDHFCRLLRGVRRRGYGVNNGLTERGVFAIGIPVRNPDGRAVAAMCISAPTMRLGRGQVPGAADTLRRTVSQVEVALARRPRQDSSTTIAS